MPRGSPAGPTFSSTTTRSDHAKAVSHEEGAAPDKSSGPMSPLQRKDKTIVHTNKPKNEENNQKAGRGFWRTVTDTIGHLLTDPPHDPDQPPVGPGPLGLEWK